MSYLPVNDGVRVKGRSVHWEAEVGPHDWIKTSRFTPRVHDWIFRNQSRREVVGLFYIFDLLASTKTRSNRVRVLPFLTAAPPS